MRRKPIVIKIYDADEKKMIIAYQKLCSNRAVQNLLCNSSIYSAWFLRWRDDFVIDRKCLKMYHQKFVVSANKHRKGIEAPEYYKEYNMFINTVTDWMKRNYEAKQSRKNNRRKFAEMLMEYRKNCAETAMSKLKECLNLSGCELIYALPNVTDKKFMELVKYSLVYNKKEIFKGSFDEVIRYMENTDCFNADKLNK